MKYRSLLAVIAVLLLHQPLAAQKKWPKKLNKSIDVHKRWVAEHRPKSLFGQKITPGEWPEGWPLIYANLSARIGPLYGGSVSATALISKRHEVSAGFAGYFRKTSYPADFTCGSCKHGLGTDEINGVVLNYGYVLYPSYNPGIFRFVLRAGVMIGHQSITNNFQPASNPSSRLDNYTYTYDNRPAAALQLHPTLDIAVGRNPGISIGPYAIFSRDFSGAGLTLGVLTGRVGNVNLRPWWESNSPSGRAARRKAVSEN